MKRLGMWCVSLWVLVFCAACAPEEEPRETNDAHVSLVQSGALTERGGALHADLRSDIQGGDDRLLGLAASSITAPERMRVESQLEWPERREGAVSAGLKVMLLDTSMGGDRGLVLNCGRVDAWKICQGGALDALGGPCLEGWRSLGGMAAWMSLQEGGRLGIAELPRGAYSALRVRVIDAAIEKDGRVEEATVEDEFYRGVVLPLQFSLEEGELTTLELGIDGRESMSFHEGEGWLVSARGLEMVGVSAEKWRGLLGRVGK